MKITVNLTETELKNIVARHLHLNNCDYGPNLSPNDLEVNITYESRWLALKGWNNVARTNPSRKIEAIKAVRETYPGTGLADAKRAVEAEWSLVERYVTINGSLNGFANYNA